MMDRAKMHDAAIEAADTETVDLLDAKDDAFMRYSDALSTLNKAYDAAYGRAYDRLEKQHATDTE